MKIGSTDIISRATLRTSTQLSLVSGIVLVTIIWNSDFKDLSVAGVRIVDSNSFFWTSLFSISVLMIGHWLTWQDDFLSYKHFRNLAADVGKNIDDILRPGASVHPDSELAHSLSQTLFGGIDDFRRALKALENMVYESEKRQLAKGEIDFTKEFVAISKNLPILLRKSDELKVSLGHLAQAVEDTRPSAQAAWRVSFWNFVVYRGILPFLFGAAAIGLLLAQKHIGFS